MFVGLRFRFDVRRTSISGVDFRLQVLAPRSLFRSIAGFGCHQLQLQARVRFARLAAVAGSSIGGFDCSFRPCSTNFISGIDRRLGSRFRDQIRHQVSTAFRLRSALQFQVAISSFDRMLEVLFRFSLAGFDFRFRFQASLLDEQQ